MIIIYNTIKNQIEDKYVNTCGSHVAHRVYILLHNSMALEDYHKFMRDLSKTSNLNYDLIVSTFANFINEK